MEFIKSFFGLLGVIALSLCLWWTITLFTYAGYRTLAPELGWTVPEFWAVFWSLLWFGVAAAIPSALAYLLKG